MDACDLVLVGVVVLGAVLLTMAWTHDTTDNSWREQIANHGHAEFYLDEKHERQWRWK